MSLNLLRFLFTVLCASLASAVIPMGISWNTVTLHMFSWFSHDQQAWVEISDFISAHELITKEMDKIQEL